MSEILKKMRRQVEILAIALDNPDGLKPLDLADRYGCEELTIKRDLKELRTEGFDLHSERNGGLRLSHPADARRIRQMIVRYVGLSNADTAVDRATSLLVRGHGPAALVHVVRLQQCVEQRKVARIIYQKEPDEPAKQYDIQPYTLFQSESTWRVLAGHDGIAKQYLLTRLRSVLPTDRSFKGIERELIEEMFRTSFRSWLGPEQHRIRLLLSPRWAHRLRPLQLVETQSLHERKDGSAVLEATVSSLDEVAAWVVGKGAGVTVLGPAKLREKVVALARGALENHTRS